MGQGDDPAAWIWRTSYKVAAGLLEARHRQPMTTARPPDRPVIDEPLIETLALLDCLAPQQRAIVALRYLAALKPAAIAEILNTSSGNVRVQLHRAHEILRRTWSES